MHPYFHSRIVLKEELTYDSQLQGLTESIKKFQIETYSGKKTHYRITIKLTDNRHANYFISFMLKYGKALNLTVTYELFPASFQIDIWFKTQ